MDEERNLFMKYKIEDFYESGNKINLYALNNYSLYIPTSKGLPGLAKEINETAKKISQQT